MKKLIPIIGIFALISFASCNVFKNAKCTECPEWTEKQKAKKVEETAVAHNGNSYCSD